MRTRLFLLLCVLATATGCAAAGDIFAGNGQSRTLGTPPDDDDDAVGDDDDLLGDDDDTGPGDDDDSVPVGDLATGLDIVRVSFTQSVMLDLVADETAATDLPIVTGRAGLLRVHVAPQDDFAPRDIVASLAWDPGTDELAPLDLQDTMLPLGASEDGDRSSTFEFAIPEEYVLNGASWSVELHETGGGSGPGTDDFARWPRESGTQIFLAYDNGPLRVLIVPIAYNADGSGRLPDTSPSQLTVLSNWLYRIYPAAEIELVVDEPLELSYSVSPGGNGWGDLLYDITDLRQTRDVPGDTYIYGMFRPADTIGQFCGGGCVAGLSWRADSPNDAWARASIGLGYSGEGAAGTMIHEIGHAHGRAHANCGVGNPDPSYPYADGRLGVWGWDPFADALRSPDEYRDMMGYCSPRWVSDYTWLALHQRINYVNANFEWVNGPPVLPWRIVGVGVDGQRGVRGTVPIRGTPPGDAVHVDLLDGSGTVVGGAQGRYRDFDHLAGGTLLVPEPGAHVAALRVDGEVLTLPR